MNFKSLNYSSTQINKIILLLYLADKLKHSKGNWIISNVVVYLLSFICQMGKIEEMIVAICVFLSFPDAPTY